jgi:MFS transporter, OFA family, oxalate/formate antiporter
MADNTTVQSAIQNRGWTVTFSAMGINLALGILYTWSIISKGIPSQWGWSEAQKSLPYAVACLVFSIIMVPAGRMQDRFGPRLVASFGGILVGIGMLFTSFSTSPLGYIIGFGVLTGSGIGFGYASATPPSVKWFPGNKTGMISGIVVSGFGLASVYAAPLTNYLITTYGLQKTVMILGVLFLVVVLGLAQLLVSPPLGYNATLGSGKTPDDAQKPAKPQNNYRPSEVLKTPQFYLLWFMYMCGAGAGLMVIAKLAAIVKNQAGISLGFILVIALAIGNGAGRILTGMVSDKIGRRQTLLICFIFQAILVLVLSRVTTGSVLASFAVLSLISALIGANYGANLALFPAITKDYYGLKNFGMNYGLVFTAWGMGGFMLSFFVGKLYDMYHSFSYAYYGSSILLVLAAFVSFFVKPPVPKDSV